jgi:tetratricopeptide (TPR) repeat protein
VLAPAKLNLFLHINARRSDGYHLLQSVFTLIDWCDVLHFEVSNTPLIQRLDLTIPLPAEDLIVRAARLLQEASQFHQKGQLEQALSIYQTILAKHPQQADALHLSGVVAFQQKRPEEAIALLQKALKQKPDLVPAYNTLGLILAARNDHQQAIVQYDQAIKLDPQFSEAFYNKGIALFKLKQYEFPNWSFINRLLRIVYCCD